jgi:hypothetical protein
MLTVCTVLGISAAMLIPSMSQTGVLRVQAAVRTVISDIVFAQSDAVAFQQKRAIVFDVAHSSYRLVEVPGDVRITAATFDGSNALIFDALGGPVHDAGSNAPGNGGSITITGSGSTFLINVEAFTGRVTVTKLPEGGN